MPTQRPHHAEPPRALLLGIAFAQGVALLMLRRAIGDEYWPSQTPVLNFPLWTAAIALPGLLLLGLEATAKRSLVVMAGALTAFLALLAAWVGWQASPAGAFPVWSLVGEAAMSLLVICFIVLMHLQPWSARQRPAYPLLFALSWRNFLVAALALLSTQLCNAVLLLWGLLFSAIGIDFFEELFRKDWFLFPTLALVWGFSVYIFRRLARLIDGITGLLAGLMRLLLPLVVAVVAVFLVALPFTGLAPLWETRNGTLLLLWLNALVLFFANAVYQSGTETPYPMVLHRALAVGIALLPVVSGLAAYGLALRVGQVGWSVERCWAAVICAWFGALSLGYAGFVVWRREAWTQGLGPVNRTLGWALVAILALANSPLLDFRTLSLASQWQRVESGELALRDFDFAYAKETLARPGWRKTQALIDEYALSDPKLAHIIREAGRETGSAPRLEWDRVQYRPERFDVPAGARDEVDDAIRRWWPRGELDSHQAAAARVDLNDDGQLDYAIVFGGFRSSSFGSPDLGSDEVGRIAGVVAFADGDDWHVAQLAVRQATSSARLAAVLREGDVRAVARPGKDLQIGELILTPREVRR